MEHFKHIKNCPKWLINSEGEVWSVNKGGLLSPHQNGSGYLQLVYHQKGYRKKHYIHRLVAEVFIGDIPKDHCVNHIDGNKQNNCVTNLEIVTRKRNNHHAVETGLRKKWRGSLHPQSKLNETEVKEIRLKMQNGKSPKEIAKDFNITVTTVHDLHSRRSWRWLA